MSPIACLYTVALLFISSVMASRNNVFLQRDLGLYFSKKCLKSKWNHWWLLRNGASALFSICKSSKELQYRILFFTRLLCEKTFDGKVDGDDRTLWIFHGLGSWSVMTCRSQLPGNMSLGQKKNKEMWQLDCSSVKLLWIAMMCITAGWTSCQPGLDQRLKGQAVQGCCNIPMWLPMLGGTEKPHWKRLRKAVLGGQIKTTDVTFEVLRWLENLIGVGSFSAFCCVIYYLGRKVWIIFLWFFKC